MKIGINNIFSVVLSLIFISSGGVVFYFTFIENTNSISDLGLFFLVFVCLISFGYCIFILTKFRFLTVTDEGLFCFYPFLLRTKQLKWIDLEKTEWTIFYWKGIFRKVLLKTAYTEISLTDLEFENFETLTNKIPNGERLRKEIDREQAQTEKSMMTWYNYFFSIVGLVLLYQLVITNGFLFFGIALCVDILLLCTSIKRRMQYIKILKKRKKRKSIK